MKVEYEYKYQSVILHLSDDEFQALTDDLRGRDDFNAIVRDKPITSITAFRETETDARRKRDKGFLITGILVYLISIPLSLLGLYRLIELFLLWFNQSTQADPSLPLAYHDTQQIVVLQSAHCVRSAGSVHWKALSPPASISSLGRQI